MSKTALRLIAVGLLSALAVSCGGGGGNASEDLTGQACSTKGEHQHTGDAPPGGTEWECYETSDGSLQWREWSEGGSAGQQASEGGGEDQDLSGQACSTKGEHQHTGDAPPGGTEWECGYLPDGSLGWRKFLDVNTEVMPMARHWSDGICEEREVNITHALTPNVDDIEFIFPMGNVGVKHITPVNHHYVQFKKTGVAANDLIAQADGHIVHVEGMPGDYGLVIELSCDLYIQYGHVDKLVGPIADLDGKQLGYGEGEISFRIPVKAGETVAQGGEIRIDWQMSDERVVLNGLQPRNYLRQDFWKFHTVSALDYLPGDLKPAYTAKLLRQVEPRIGKIDYDVPGTASGNWFEVGTNFYIGKNNGENMPYVNFGDTTGYWDTHLSFAPAALDGKTTLIAQGLIKPGSAGTLATKDDVDPTTIKVGDTPQVIDLVQYSYATGDGKEWDYNSVKSPYRADLKLVKQSALAGVLVIQVTSDNTMRAEVRLGANASKNAEFTDAARDYER
jgi:hypothetical protein